MDNNPAVPDGNQPITGKIIVPGSVNDSGTNVPAEDLMTHQFFNVLRHVVRHVPFVNEDELHTALELVDSFEQRNLSVPVSHVITNDDVAKREDVRLRQAPHIGSALVPVSGPPLDYNKLAAALLAQQQQMHQNRPPEGGEGTTE